MANKWYECGCTKLWSTFMAYKGFLLWHPILIIYLFMVGLLVPSLIGYTRNNQSFTGNMRMTMLMHECYVLVPCRLFVWGDVSFWSVLDEHQLHHSFLVTSAGWITIKLCCITIGRSFIVVFRLFVWSIACSDSHSWYLGSSSRSGGQMARKENQIAPETCSEVIPGGSNMSSCNCLVISSNFIIKQLV